MSLKLKHAFLIQTFAWSRENVVKTKNLKELRTKNIKIVFLNNAQLHKIREMYVEIQDILFSLCFG